LSRLKGENTKFKSRGQNKQAHTWNKELKDTFVLESHTHIKDQKQIYTWVQQIK